MQTAARALGVSRTGTLMLAGATHPRVPAAWVPRGPSSAESGPEHSQVACGLVILKSPLADKKGGGGGGGD